MVSSVQSGGSSPQLARQVRQQFGRGVEAVIGKLVGAVNEQIDSALRGGPGRSMSDLSRAMDLAGAFNRCRIQWVDTLHQNWKKTLAETPQAAEDKPASLATTRLDQLGLVDDGEVEENILVARLAAAISEKAGSEWNDFRLRVRQLQDGQDLAKNDPLRPEAFAQCVIKAWIACDLQRDMWGMVQQGVQNTAAELFTQIYQQLNAQLEQRGISAQLQMRVSGAGQRHAAPAVPPGNDEPQTQSPAGSHTGPGQPEAHAQYPQTFAPTQYNPHFNPQNHGGVAVGGGAMRGGLGRHSGMGGATSSPRSWAGANRYASSAFEPSSPGVASPSGGLSTWWRGDVRPSDLVRAESETRMATGLSPMMRVRQRAQGVWGQLKRMLSDHELSHYDSELVPEPVSPQLARALAEPAFAETVLIDAAASPEQAEAQVQVVALQLRERATELKNQAERPSEKAIIEIVALMFQSILNEERIPTSIRVWFARLQLPVLRLALAEPDFFASMEHPARQLIDRMGACALGFDAAQISTERLEREVKRIVQVIEQYPETGRRVFELVFEEFKKFLGQSLTEGQPTQQAASLAQQVEQKEALTVQYTIELRRMLAHLPVSDEVREFLFRVWSEVLAVAAVRHGPHHNETLRFKQAAAELLWAVSAKPDRSARAQVLQQLPGLLQTLRDGMATLTLKPDQQDAFIKQINDAVMKAFVARDEGLTAQQMKEVTAFLTALENVVKDEPEGEMWLDQGMVEMMFGAESSTVSVVSEGGSQPAEAIVQWARQLELGTWFAIDLQGSMAQVQYAWRSARGQLHLFAAVTGQNYLLQTQRVAAFLQAGLLVPAEDEALTVRATREALAKLQGTPTQLLQ